MEAKDVIGAVRKAIADAEVEGRDHLTCETVSRLLDRAESGALESVERTKMAEARHLQECRARAARELEELKADKNHELEMLKGVLESGQSALRSLSLINGAAAIALLSFIANGLTKAEGIEPSLVNSLSLALLAFTAGVALAGGGFAVRYLSQAWYSGQFSQDWLARQRWGDRCRNGAIVFAITAFIAFICGLLVAFTGLRAAASYTAPRLLGSAYSLTVCVPIGVDLLTRERMALYALRGTFRNTCKLSCTANSRTMKKYNESGLGV